MDGGGFVTSYIDVTDNRRNQELIAHMAHHDALTELPNRLLLKDRLQTAVAQSKRGNPMAVLYLDLDFFKPVNDTYGHGVGDAVLVAVADRLRQSTRESDTIARIGGDEFVILQSNVDKPGDAEVLATRLVSRLSEPFIVREQSDEIEIEIGVSVGIVLAPMHSSDPDQLLSMADAALYTAKSDGKGVYRFYEV